MLIRRFALLRRPVIVVLRVQAGSVSSVLHLGIHTGFRVDLPTYACSLGSRLASERFGVPVELVCARVLAIRVAA